MMSNFQEFDCLFLQRDNEINSNADYVRGKICIDLNNAIAFNRFTDERYTVLRMVDGNSYIVRCSYDDMMERVLSYVVRFEN